MAALKGKNVLGQALVSCSHDPVTGFFRDGCCHTGPQDQGVHTVCAIMTDDFLAFSKKAGNDLSTPMPQFGFPGLRHGDQWCLVRRPLGTGAPGRVRAKGAAYRHQHRDPAYLFA